MKADRTTMVACVVETYAGNIRPTMIAKFCTFAEASIFARAMRQLPYESTFGCSYEVREFRLKEV